MDIPMEIERKKVFRKKVNEKSHSSLIFNENIVDETASLKRLSIILGNRYNLNIQN